jgi:phosphatidylglycerol lysyltransferase
MLAALAFTLAYGALGFFLLDRHFRAHFGFWPAIRQTVVMFTQYYDPGLQPVTGFGRYFADSIYVVAMTTTAYALLLLIRPVLARHKASEADRLRAREIAAKHARTSLAPLTLLDDKTFFFSPGGSYVAYVVKGRAALALGDPIGPPCDAEATVSGFKWFCSLNDWFPVFYQVDAENLDLFQRLGLRAIRIGQEAIVDLAGFSLEGGERKNIRTSVNKMRRLGYSAAVLRPPHPSTLIHQLSEVSDDWLSERSTAEMKFSVGWFDEDYLNRCPVVVVRNAQDEIEAFANILMEGPNKEVAVDLMRQRKSAEKGQMDFIFASLLCWAQEEGYERFSFGLSALSGIGESPGDPAVEKALRFVNQQVVQVYNFKGLYAYKAKFGPVWYPRYLIYPDVSTLPATASALIRANTGDDLLGAYLFHPN